MGLYVLVELIFSVTTYLRPSGSIFVSEDTGQTVHFDPVMGHRLSQVPSRTTRITRGKIEYIGTHVGNAQGYPDRDDFTLERRTKDQRRFIVLGDSFSAGQFLSYTWSDRAEDLFERSGESVELLNMSGDGWGIGNWASIIRGQLRTTSYDVDGLIFVVWQDNLMRRFQFLDSRGQDKRAFVRAPSWDPGSHPKTLAEARRRMEGRGRSNTYLVPSSTFNDILRGEVLEPKNWKFALTVGIKEKVYWPLQRSFNQPESLSERDRLADLAVGREFLYDEVKSYVNERDLPVLVVYVWSREALLDGKDKWDRQYIAMTEEFADHIGATFVDSRPVYDGIPDRQLEKLYFPYDGHWNQGASDLFADFMLDHIDRLATKSIN